MMKCSLRIIFLAGCLAGCVNLQKVGTYSASSLKGLQKYEELGFTFLGACEDKCGLEQIRNVELSRGGCNCASESSADSVTTVLYNAVRGYFSGLEKLAANNLTTYKTEALTKSLKSGRYGDIKIDKAEVDAYAKISAIILGAFTNGYRRSKISNHIEEANNPIQVLIRAIEFNVATNLAGRLQVQKERTESIYFDLLSDPQASSYEKKKMIEEYNALSKEANARQKLISAFSKVLKTISSGHQKLYDNRNRMTANEIKSMLVQHASDLDDILSEFNKLKHP